MTSCQRTKPGLRNRGSTPALGCGWMRPRTQPRGAQLTRIFHTRFVAQASKPAVSRVSKPAARPARPTPCRLGSRRHSRLGSLRYTVRGARLQQDFEISGLTRKHSVRIRASRVFREGAENCTRGRVRSPRFRRSSSVFFRMVSAPQVVNVRWNPPGRFAAALGGITLGW